MLFFRAETLLSIPVRVQPSSPPERVLYTTPGTGGSRCSCTEGGHDLCFCRPTSTVAVEGTNAKRIFCGTAEFYRRTMCNHLELKVDVIRWITLKELDSLRGDVGMVIIWEAVPTRMKE